MTTAFEYASEFAALLRAVDDLGGELPDDLAARIEACGENMEQKVRNLRNWYFETLGESETIAADIVRAIKRKDTADRRAAWLKRYIGDILRTAGVDKVDWKSGRVALRRNPHPVIEIAADTDTEDLPAEYRRERRTVEPDRVALAAAWKAGLPMPAGVTATAAPKSVVIS